jgi:CAI-1 autoinducer synthase
MYVDKLYVPSQQVTPSTGTPEFLSHRIDRFYKERVQESWGGTHILRGRTPETNAIVLQSNDYLSLAAHPEIVKAQTSALIREGNGAVMSALFLLNRDSPNRVLEKRFARFLQADDAIMCQSGFAANTGLLQSIADESTPVYLDMFAHMSLWEGARSAGANAIAFHHNDADNLERQIRRYGPGVIAVDSVYSTNGSICPLEEIIALANARDCVIVVDESHSLGTHGERGCGMVAELGLEDQVHFRTASLAKAFVGRGGLITCSARFVDYFTFESRPAIFSSTLLPHEIAGFDATLTVIERDEWRRRKLQNNATYLRENLSDMGYNVDDGESQIIALESGPESQTKILRDALEAREIFGSVFCAPATPKNRSIIRFSVQSGFSQQDLDKILAVCYDIREEVGLEKWASSRRKNQRAARTLSTVRRHRVDAPETGIAAM